MMKRSGFTLIELLTVISIIAVLAALLFPVFVTVRKSAQGTQCASNLRQMNSAFSMYMDSWQASRPIKSEGFCAWGKPNNNGLLGWSVLLYKYHHKLEIYKCPSRKVNYAYSYNESLEMGVPRLPSKTLLIFECPGNGGYTINPKGNNLDSTGDSDLSNGNSTQGGQRDGDVYGGASSLNREDKIENYQWLPRTPQDNPFSSVNLSRRSHYLFFPGPHNGISNVLFYDGHVEGLKDWKKNAMTFDPR